MNGYKIFERTKLLSLALACLLVFSACGNPPLVTTQAPPLSPDPPTQTPAALQVMSFEPSATSQPVQGSTTAQDQQPTLTSAPAEDLPPTETATPAATQGVATDEQTCSRLQNPQPGAQLPATGWWIFEWDAWPQAATYVLEIIAPSGWALSIETDKTSVPRALEALSTGGEYTWSVAALSATSQELCRSNSQSFSKPARPPTSTPSTNLAKDELGPEPPCNCGP